MENLTRRLGRINIAKVYLTDRNINDVQEIFKVFIPFEAVDSLGLGVQSDVGSIQYGGYSEQFDELSENEPIPEYDCLFETVKDQTVFKGFKKVEQIVAVGQDNKKDE